MFVNNDHGRRGNWWCLFWTDWSRPLTRTLSSEHPWIPVKWPKQAFEEEETENWLHLSLSLCLSLVFKGVVRFYNFLFWNSLNLTRSWKHSTERVYPSLSFPNDKLLHKDAGSLSRHCACVRVRVFLWNLITCVDWRSHRSQETGSFNRHKEPPSRYTLTTADLFSLTMIWSLHGGFCFVLFLHF